MARPVPLAEIVSALQQEPVRIPCARCSGARRIRSATWQVFVDTHGEAVVARARAAAAQAKKKHAMSFEILWTPTAAQLVEAGLPEPMASDFAGICGEPEMIECQECHGEGEVLTETGRALLDLKKLLETV